MKKLATVLFSAVMLTGVVGCGSSTSSSTSSATSSNTTTTTPAKGKTSSLLKTIQKKGYVRVGFANENPFGYVNSSGILKGESVAVTRAVFKKMGIKVKLEGVVTQFGSLIPGLLAHRFDMVSAGMYIEPARCKLVAFGNPDYKIGESMAVKAGNPMHLNSYKAIAKNANAKVGVMAGAIEKTFLLKSGVKASQIISYPNEPAELAALKAGRVNAITMTSLSLTTLLKKHPTSSVAIVKHFSQPVIGGKSVVSYGAVVFNKANVNLRHKYDKALAQLEKSGQLLKILAPYGFTKANLPGSMTAKKACAA